MNTFASLLLAFPLYLAVNGKLAAVIALAKPGAAKQAGAANAPQPASKTTQPVNSGANAGASQTSADITQPADSTGQYMAAAESVMMLLS